MAQFKYRETDHTIPHGGQLVYSNRIGGNVFQIINIQATGGGTVFVHRNDRVSADEYLLKVEQGNTGAFIRPYPVDQLYFSSNAPGDVRVTIIELDTPTLDVVYNASQVLELTGQVEVAQPLQVDFDTSNPLQTEVTNDSANPVPVTITDSEVPVSIAGEVEITNDSGNPIPVSVGGTVNANVSATDALPVSIADPVTVDGEVSLASGTSVAITGPVMANQGIPKSLGSDGNAWNGAVLADGVSTAIDFSNCVNGSAFGTVDAATTLTLQVSQDATNYYDTTYTVELTDAGDFYLDFIASAHLYRLKSSGAATIKATLAGKGQ